MNDRNRTDDHPRFEAHARRRHPALDERAHDEFLVASLRRSMDIECASRRALDHETVFGHDQAHLVMVADSRDDVPASSVSGRAAVESLLDQLLNGVPWTPDLDLSSEVELRQALEDAVARSADVMVKPSGRRSGDGRAAASTTLAFVRWPTAFVVHAGTSRAYLVRRGSIERLTDDVDLEAKPSGSRSGFAELVWRTLGGDSEIEPQLAVARLQPGDSLVLCTEGLTQCVPESGIREVLEAGSSAEASCDALVQRAGSDGGEFTVAVARFPGVAADAVKQEEAPRPGPLSAVAEVPLDRRPVRHVAARPTPGTSPDALLGS